MAKVKTNEIEVKSLNVWSVGKIYGVICAVMGFFVGLIGGLLIIGGVTTADAAIPGMTGAGPAIGVLVIIFSPILYGLIGLVSGIICAIVYNFAAPKVGGIKFSS